MKKFALISLGCAKNLVDSEVMLGSLEQAGYSLEPAAEKADILIVNTCGFIQPARREAMDTLREVAELKRSGIAKKIVVTGCYVEKEKELLQHKYPEVDTWTGVKDFDKIVQIIEGKPYKASDSCFLYDHTSARRLSTPAAWAYVKISEGCSHQCAFCTIPLIKGPYRSRPVGSIVQEAESLVSRGILEINLISQDSTYYGRDLGMEEGISLLLQNLIKIPKLKWVRILYGYPEEISDSLLEIMQEEKICSYIDVPFQHAASSIIKNMKRGMDGTRALKLIQKIRTRIPDMALRTSLIVGFPGEGNKEFEFLKNFVSEVRFDHMGVFTYSPEQGTENFRLGDPVKESVKKKRSDQILELQAEISFANNEKYLNKQRDVLIEGHLKQDKDVLVGRSSHQAPEVDGVVFMEFSGPLTDIVNTIQKVEITDRDVYDLYGKFIK